jgi:diaminopimelate epimerase
VLIDVKAPQFLYFATFTTNFAPLNIYLRSFNTRNLCMKVVKPIPFQKFHGAGNDFILLQKGVIEPKPELIIWLCDRHLGIGADGLIILSDAEKSDFKLTYFNSDGLEGSLCGNGSRVAIASKYMADRSRKNWQFEAIDGLHQGSVLMEHQYWFDIRISMQDVNSFIRNEMYLLADTGSPHYITEVDNLAALDVARLGAEIRHNKSISADGVNVNFMQFIDDNHFELRTFERGVEAETLSCGTGVTAAAIAAALKTGNEHFVIKTKGGELQVNLKQKGKGFGQIFLRGPVQFVFDGSVYPPENLI